MKRKPFIILAAAIAAPTLFLIHAWSNLALISVSRIVVGLFLLSADPLVLTFAEQMTKSALTGMATSIPLLRGNA